MNWILDYLDEHKGEVVRHCKACSEKHGTMIYAPLRDHDDALKRLRRFEKQHYWCGFDRNFAIKFLELQVGELDDKQKAFIHTCMDEGIDRDTIQEFLTKKRQKMPSLS